jgi:hypothetical protein
MEESVFSVHTKGNAEYQKMLVSLNQGNNTIVLGTEKRKDSSSKHQNMEKMVNFHTIITRENK